MTYDDAIRTTQAAGLGLDIGAHDGCRDSYLSRRDRGLVVAVRPNLLEPYLVFAIFHQVAHYLDHSAGPAYPVITFDNVAGAGDDNELTIIARHAVRRRGRVVEWEPRPFALRRYLAMAAPVSRESDTTPAPWTDEDVLRVLRAGILVNDVKHGRARIGAHHRTLRDFSAALAHFQAVVGGGIGTW